MADDAPNQDETPVTFNVKSSSDAKFVITVPLSLTILDLKQKLSATDYADIPAERQRLIYSGRVLKDPDTLASYKIKEGNTVHLVKGAASNQKQQPSNTSADSASTSQPATGVPTNLAAGTGRDPLTGLTGARYAGYAQMPNANIFGPDGGMGPPPDSEQIASQLEDPAFASQLNEALSNPDIVERMIQSNPLLQGPMAQQARQMFNDPNMRRMMTDPEMIRNINNMRRNMPGLFGGMGGLGGQAGQGNQAFPMPGNASSEDNQQSQRPSGGQQTQEGQPSQPPVNPFPMLNPTTGAASATNPFAALFGGGPQGNTSGNTAETANRGSEQRATDANAEQQQSGQQTASSPFQAASQLLTQNPQLMQQMLGALGQQPQTNNPNEQQAFNPFAALQALGGPDALNPGAFGAFGGPSPSQPADDRPPEDRYAEQLRQLNEMGFYEFDRNIEALRRTGGSVQGAVEYLLTH